MDRDQAIAQSAMRQAGKLTDAGQLAALTCCLIKEIKTLHPNAQISIKEKPGGKQAMHIDYSACQVTGMYVLSFRNHY